MKRLVTNIIALFIGSIALAQTTSDGLKAIDFEKYEKARGIFSSLIVTEPTNAENYYWLGQCYSNLFKPDSAAWAYNSGITVAPKYPQFYAGLGELLLSDNRVEDARKQFDNAMSLCKNKQGYYTDYKGLIAVASAMITGENKMLAEAEQLIKEAYEINKTDYDILVTAGDVFLEMMNGSGAATYYNSAVTLDPNRPKAYAKIAYIWIKVKNYEAAKTALDNAFAKDPNYATAYKNQAELYSYQRKYALAKESFKKYLENSEPSPANKRRFALLLIRAKEYEEALPVVEDVLKSEPNDIYLNRMFAICSYEVGNSKNDLELIKKGVNSADLVIKNTDGKKVTANDYVTLGKLQSKVSGMDSLAIINMKKALEMDEKQIDIYQELAKAYNKMKRFAEAATAYETFMSKTPKVKIIDYYTVGRYYYYARQFGKADTAFMKVSELKPDYADAYLQRGNTNAFIDPDANTTVAKGCYEKYLAIEEASANKNNKGIVEAYIYLGKYAIKKDDNASAKSYFEKVLAIDPNNTSAKDILKQLK